MKRRIPVREYRNCEEVFQPKEAGPRAQSFVLIAGRAIRICFLVIEKPQLYQVGGQLIQIAMDSPLLMFTILCGLDESR